MKNNGKFWAVIGILVVLGMAVAGWVWNAAIIYQRVDNNITDIENIEQNVIPQVDSNSKAIIGIQKDLDYLQKRVDENAHTQQQILTVQQEILREVKR